jgi:hypothetical protein
MQPVARQRGKSRCQLLVYQGAVRQHDGGGSVAARHLSQQRRHVVAEERLAPSEVEGIGAQRTRLAHDLGELVRGDPVAPARPRGHQAVPARQVAAVAHMEPDLPQPLRLQIARPAPVGGPVPPIRELADFVRESAHQFEPTPQAYARSLRVAVADLVP